MGVLSPSLFTQLILFSRLIVDPTLQSLKPTSTNLTSIKEIRILLLWSGRDGRQMATDIEDLYRTRYSLA